MKISVSNLRKSYFLEGKEVPVLHGLDLTIESGELASLTGPSGVGKSTLLHILGTLDSPTSGVVELNDVNVFSKSPAEMADFRNQQIGFVFQFHHLLPEFTALENVAMPLLIRRQTDGRAKREAQQWLERVGLSHRLTHKPGELSGGEQQRVALARALVTGPSLLLADEPTGNLDDDTGAGIIDLMRSLNTERGLTVLVVTHNQRLAASAPRRLTLQSDLQLRQNREQQ